MTWSEHEFECDRSLDGGAYLLGALSEEEALSYREHLNSCAVCRQELDQLANVVDQLSVAVGHASAPRELHERIMATVNAEAEVLHAAGSQADRPVRSARWRVRPMFLALGGAGAAALGVLLGALVIASGNGPTKHLTAAIVSGGARGATAELRQVDSRTELDVSRMPAPPSGRIYEVWLQRSNGSVQPTDSLFSVTNKGTGSVAVPGDLHGVKAVMVTDEPLGGSLAPTRSPIIVVRLS